MDILSKRDYQRYKLLNSVPVREKGKVCISLHGKRRKLESGKSAVPVLFLE